MAKSDKAEIHEMVTKVAKDMMLKYGLRGLNMVELARECGLAKATLYKIIGTKEDLVKEIAFEIFNMNIIKILEPYRIIDDPVEATRIFLDNYLNYAITAQKILIQQIYKEYPLIEKDVEEKYENEKQIVNQCYINWQKKGLIRQDINVEYCIEALQALNEVYVTASHSEEETIERLRASFRCMLLGMGIDV
ncbi:TetR/AcrR family transcriptional regulator [Ancylomarina salipaludis]|uniref:TetR/AcrR family transcriptional regulator n=1 Tax=Ancylomarina salipaludis TaxID=2501299 RepID=A0A4Q1JJ46_9BACT|nr:TetR/AcrR family transcriptional regulator [Ancylomarina salipaludis]RXQ88153.1 TetR/AcrR family transcriptional regulator [Ancylomarina salipaludis]